MTTTGLAASSLQEGCSRKVEACGFCRRRLADEFFFTCRPCHASYCYIHMSRHQPSHCKRQVRKNGIEGAIADGRRRDEEARSQGEVFLIRAGSKSSGGPSANV